MAAAGAKARRRNEWFGTRPPSVLITSSARIAAESRTIALAGLRATRREHQETCQHEEPGIAQGEFEANAQPRLSIHASILTPASN